jgi:4'-phosphopantetheinyl transferase
LPLESLEKSSLAREGWNELPAPLSGSDTHVWAVDLDVDVARLARLEKLLSSDELERAWRYRFARDRARFVAGRGLLRQVLARYLDLSPQSLRFRHAEFGKPCLALDKEVLRFNASGCEGVALIAVRRDAEVGVDIERVRRLPDFDSLAGRLLPEREIAELSSLSEQEREKRFFATWVRKEAVAKMLGLGLSQPLDGPSSPAYVMLLPPPHPNFAAAIASAADFGTVRLITRP